VFFFLFQKNERSYLLLINIIINMIHLFVVRKKFKT